MESKVQKMPAELDTTSVLHMLSAHEGRLQRLESVQSELVGEVAEQAATLKAFSHQIELMTESVCSKLDTVYERLNEKIVTMSDSSKQISEESKRQQSRIEVLEKSERTEEKKIDFRYKVLFYLLSGVGGAVAIVVGQWIKNHF